MKTSFSLHGSWVSKSADDTLHGYSPNCIFHVIDDRTCVYEQRIDFGIMITWFQYWTSPDGILRYPLSGMGRSLFKVAESVLITLRSKYLIMNGHRFDRACDLPIPERFDRFPGTRPDENGLPIPTHFKCKLLEYLAEPP
jgi:hypothetical protein